MRYRVIADYRSITVQEQGGGEVVLILGRGGLESTEQMDDALTRRGFALEGGGWSSTKMGKHYEHSRWVTK